MSISEYNQPAIVNAGPQSPIKTAVPKQYPILLLSSF